MKNYTYVLLALVAMAAMANDTISNRIYKHTALDIWCQKCPPGTHWIAHCTEDDHQAKCRPCDNGTFQTAHTLAESCEPCREFCKTDREDLVLNCSTRTNNFCVCKPGYHRLASPNDICIKHSPCPAGVGVVEIGTADFDTKCQVCEEGYFSPNISLTQICQPCSKCPEGYMPKRPCAKDADTVCVPEKNEDNLPIIIGCIAGAVVVLLVVILVICIRARRGRGPKVLQNICRTRHSSDTGTLQEKIPLSDGKSPSIHNLIPNGDVVDKAENGVQTEDLPGTVPDDILVHLSHDLICPNWAFFFRQLIGQSADKHIDESMIDNKGVREQIYKLLIKWKRMEKRKATIDVIVTALRKSDHADLASKYSKYSDRKITDV